MSSNLAGTPGATAHAAPEPHRGWLDRPLGEFMIRDPVTVESSDSLRAVQVRMSRTAAGHIPVLEHGRPVGLVTARDLARSMPVPITVLDRGEMERLLAVPVREFMSTPVIALPANERMGIAVARMVEAGVGAVLVVDPASGLLEGLLTRSAIVRLVASSV